MGEVLQRTCLGCNLKKNKKSLLRIVKNKQENIEIDRNQNKDGRGAYICYNLECLNLAIKKRKFERSFSCKIDEKVYENIKNEIEK